MLKNYIDWNLLKKIKNGIFDIFCTLLEQIVATVARKIKLSDV